MSNTLGADTLGGGHIGDTGTLVSISPTDTTAETRLSASNLQYVTLRNTLLSNNPNDPVNFEDDELLAIIVDAVARALDESLTNTSAAGRDLFVDTAINESLELLGEAVDEPRPSGEGDGRYRTRVTAGYGRATSDTSIKDFTTVLLDVLDTDADNVTLSGASDRPVVIVTVDTDVIDNSLFTEAEIVDFLNDSVPSGHNVEIESVGTFEFDGENYTPDSNTGFDEGTFGGVLNE